MPPTSSDPTMTGVHAGSDAAQLKITHAALKAFLNDFGHDERDVHALVRQILAKLPDESSIRAIDLDAGR